MLSFCKNESSTKINLENSIIMTKNIFYVLNGVRVSKEVIKKRKGVLKSEKTDVTKYYTCPLTEEEIEQKKVEDQANIRYFQKIREDRQEMEKFH